MYKSDKLNNEQKLSQLMDGEWHGLNPSDCTAALCADKALQAKWARYHMIRDVLKNEPLQADPEVASRICAAIADEPSYSNITQFSGATSVTDTTLSSQIVTETESETGQAEQSATIPDRKKTSWINTGVAGFALAASVALVTVVGLNVFEQQDQPGISQVAAVDEIPFVQDSRAVLPVVEFVANTGSFWVSPDSSQRVIDEQRLNMMLSQHIENSPTSVREGMLSYSRLVGYEDE